MKHNCQVDKSVEDIILLWMYSNVTFHRSAMTCTQSSCMKFNYFIEFILEKQKQNAHFFMIIINYANYIFFFFLLIDCC